MMPAITVIGPINGVYHLGYQTAGGFYSINEFVSKDLAALAAWKMTSDRQTGVM